MGKKGEEKKMMLLGKPVAEELRTSFNRRIADNKGRVLTVICDDTTDRGYLASIRREADLWSVKVETAKTPLEAAKAGAKKVIDLRENPPFLYGFPLAVDGQAYSDCTQVYHETGVSNTTPCTAEAVIRILDFYGISLDGQNTVIIGRSPRVGKPLALMLLARNSTVTVCHSHTPKMELNAALARANIIVCASGQKGLLDHWTQSRYLDRAQTVVNVGGDFDEDATWAKTSGVNLVPFVGGVGPVTTAVLMSHVM